MSALKWIVLSLVLIAIEQAEVWYTVWLIEKKGKRVKPWIPVPIAVLKYVAIASDVLALICILQKVYI